VYTKRNVYTLLLPCAAHVTERTVLMAMTRVTIGFPLGDNERYLVRPNDTMRYFKAGTSGRDWPSVAHFDRERTSGRKGEFTIYGVAVFTQKEWVTLENYPQGRAFPSMRVAVEHARAVAQRHGYHG
jgi:hypothetical protein